MGVDAEWVRANRRSFLGRLRAAPYVFELRYSAFRDAGTGRWESMRLALDMVALLLSPIRGGKR